MQMICRNRRIVTGKWKMSMENGDEGSQSEC